MPNPLLLPLTTAVAKAAARKIPQTTINKIARLTKNLGKKDDAKSNDELMDYVEKVKDKYGRQVEDIADDFYTQVFPKMKKSAPKNVTKKRGGGRLAPKKQSGHNRLYQEDKWQQNATLLTKDQAIM